MQSNYREKIRHFLNWFKSIKHMKYHDTSSYVKKISKVLLLTSDNFRESKTNLWTATLSFYSIFSMIPILAIVFSVAKSLGFQNLIQKELLKAFPIEQKGFDYILVFINNLLDSTKEGILAVIAFFSLIWAIIKIFSLIEYSFNAIWKVDNSRNIFRKATDYTSIVILVPLAIIIANLISAYINIKINYFISEGYNFGIFIRLTLFLLRYTALFTTCFLLSLIYIIVPNTKVKLNSAFLGGITAGISIHFLQMFLLKFQYFLLSYNVIYGSFSILPIFLILQRYFWNIVLLGCHMSFIHQNFYKYDYSLSPIKLSNREKKNISLMIMYIIINNFHNKKNPISTLELAQELKLSFNLVQSLLGNLIKLELINKIESNDEEIRYQPSFDINFMTIKFIEDKLEYFGKNNVLEFDTDNSLYFIYNNLINKAKEKSNIKILDINSSLEEVEE